MELVELVELEMELVELEMELVELEMELGRLYGNYSFSEVCFARLLM
jgi:hypothetical protein